ncbi:catalase [Gracilibacillus alcaliphilus]|uniref:catalase n=1 Tax=Gracilibacillus alcaliphilus TaxID=1401441 RepID=UPI00195C0CD4|nr:catalase [Gracilibacillus alcaliphilus]MBM7678902.1 catalase [Gracilibacillus alcaliphilus]
MSDNKQNPQQGKPISVRKTETITENKHADRQYKQSDNPPPLYSQTVGKNGPILEQDNILHEKLETFIHEKIVERPLHVKGFGAFGYFETLNSMSKYTKLPFLQRAGQTVPVAVRFSLGASNKGTPDTSRNIRGFSTKFYTDDGIFDLICNHIPVFLLRDPMRFPESVEALSPSPRNNLMDPERLWSFVASTPESTNFIVRLFSDQGTVKSLRRIPGYSVSTYVWRNAEGKRHYIKYCWIPFDGEEYITSQEAEKLAAINPDYAGEDLYQTIASGKVVEYGLYVQMMDLKDREQLPFDPLDDTKVWDEMKFPFHPVGKMVLNRNPENYMEQVEKIAFSPSNLLDGAELSEDRILQGRANIYWDSQRYRIGPLFRNVPVNAQKHWQPGVLQTSGEERYVEGKFLRSTIARQDDFSQAGDFYQSLSQVEKSHLVSNLVTALTGIRRTIQVKVIEYLSLASRELGERISAGLRE